MSSKGNAVFETELTYKMPEDTRGKIKYLSDLMRVPSNLVTQMGEARSCEILTGLAVYHHLPQGGSERRTVLANIHAAPGPLRAPLINKVTDPLINPLWGIWAMSKEDLFRQYEFFDAVSTFGNLVGVSFSMASGTQAIRELVRQNFARASVQTFVATAVAWGFFWNNEAAKNQIREELFRRAGKQII